jgi:hypothetical protein
MAHDILQCHDDITVALPHLAATTITALRKGSAIKTIPYRNSKFSSCIRSVRHNALLATGLAAHTKVWTLVEKEYQWHSTANDMLTEEQKTKTADVRRHKVTTKRDIVQR